MSMTSALALAFTLLTLEATETGTDTGTDSGTTEGGVFGNCTIADPPQILAPLDGALVESPFVVEVDPGRDCWCDDGGCWYVEFDNITIRSAGEPVAGGASADFGPFEVALAPGTYELVARSEWDFGFSSSTPITITVIEGDPPATDTGSTDTGSTDTGSTDTGSTESGSGGTGGNLTAGNDEAAGESGAGLESNEGCNCSTDRQAPALAGLALFGLLALRRRRGEG